MNNPNIPASFQITGNPAIDGVILKLLTAAAAGLTGIILTWLTAHGFSDPNLGLMLSGAVFSVLCTIAVTAWGFFQSKVNQARAVQAGVNMTVSGNALAADGKTVVEANDGSTPPLPVTTATAAQIVKKFASPLPAK